MLKVPSPSHLRTLLIAYWQRVVFEFMTYALASRLRASWMEARVTKVARVSARFSKSFVAPLDDLHAQRRHLCHRSSVNLPGVVAAISPDQFEPREAQPRISLFRTRGSNFRSTKALSPLFEGSV
jgi:hypothetical protein